MTDKAISLVASVVLPTHGRRLSLLQVLQKLRFQSVPPDSFEVIVICDGDVDGSVAACHALAPTLPYHLRILEQPNQGPAAARNRGVAEARASLVIFIDDDVMPDARLIAEHLEAQSGQDRRVTIGPLLPPPDARLSPWGEWEERTLCRQYDDMMAGRWEASYRQFYTGNASVLRQHIIDAGGFDPAYRRAEDVELALRLRDCGLHFVFLPNARGWHYVQRSFDSWRHLPEAYSAADIAMARAGWPETLAHVPDLFPTRNLVVRAVTRLCVGRPTVVHAVTMLFGLLIKVAALTKSTSLGTLGCSLTFNLCYYHGIATAIGGRAPFMKLLRGQAVGMLLAGLDKPVSASVH